MTTAKPQITRVRPARDEHRVVSTAVSPPTVDRWDHTRTGRLVLAGLWIDALLVMGASAWNGGRALEILGDPLWAGVLLGLAVDVGLAVALVGDRALHLAGRIEPWGRALRVATAVMSLALNCAVPLWLGQVGLALFHGFLPILLVLLSEYAQASTLQFRAITAEHEARERAIRDADAARRRTAVEEEAAERRREIAAEHAETERIRAERDTERRAAADRLAALRDTEAKAALAEAEAAVAAERTAAAAAEAAVIAARADADTALLSARAEADRQETARLRAEARVGGQDSGQTRGQRGDNGRTNEGTGQLSRTYPTC